MKVGCVRDISEERVKFRLIQRYRNLRRSQLCSKCLCHVFASIFVVVVVAAAVANAAELLLLVCAVKWRLLAINGACNMSFPSCKIPVNFKAAVLAFSYHACYRQVHIIATSHAQLEDITAQSIILNLLCSPCPVPSCPSTGLTEVWPCRKRCRVVIVSALLSVALSKTVSFVVLYFPFLIMEWFVCKWCNFDEYWRDSLYTYKYCKLLQ